MAGYLVTQRARRDILDLWRYISRDSELIADRFLHELIERFSVLGQNPELGVRITMWCMAGAIFLNCGGGRHGAAADRARYGG